MSINSQNNSVISDDFGLFQRDAGHIPRALYVFSLQGEVPKRVTVTLTAGKLVNYALECLTMVSYG